jgi:hypothetical protein
MSKQNCNTRRTVMHCANAGILAAMLAGTLMAKPAAAQDTSDLQSLFPGQRVRIAAPGVAPGNVVGSISKLDTDSVTVDMSGRHQSISVPRDKILSVDVSEGPRSRWVDLGIGAGTGFAAGAVFGLVAQGRSRTGFVSDGAVAAVCGLLGGGLGALIGATIPPGERWHRLSTSSYRISFVPRFDHDLGFALAMAF